ncbi:hypothetical protein TNCV_1262591 [Trichonephila clavipes]|nr:hypothetical protein TNCV_1262591 [Trichonephila clavipes]
MSKEVGVSLFFRVIHCIRLLSVPILCLSIILTTYYALRYTRGLKPETEEKKEIYEDEFQNKANDFRNKCVRTMIVSQRKEQPNNDSSAALYVSPHSRTPATGSARLSSVGKADVSLLDIDGCLKTIHNTSAVAHSAK